jgi:hypothetical protein
MCVQVNLCHLGQDKITKEAYKLCVVTGGVCGCHVPLEGARFTLPDTVDKASL